MSKARVFLFALLFGSALAGAAQFQDSRQEAQYYELIRTIRCPTCQNQNIAESDAPLARQLREQIESQIKQGRNSADITDYLVERYGDFITYAPPFAARTWLLWLMPLMAMLAALAVWLARRPRQSASRTTLNDAEKAELDTLLKRYRNTP